MDPLNIAMLDLHKMDPRIFRMIDCGDIDPWDMDLVKLCEVYITEIKARQDLRISGNALLTAAVLLRFKSKVFDEKEEAPPVEKPELSMPDIEIIPISRKIERKVTVFELLDALKEAFELERQRAKSKKQPEIKFYAFNMSKAVEKVLASLPKEIRLDAVGSVTLLALLHLAMKGVIEIEQEKWNGAIRIRKLGGSSSVYGGQTSQERKSGEYA